MVVLPMIRAAAARPAVFSVQAGRLQAAASAISIPTVNARRVRRRRPLQRDIEEIAGSETCDRAARSVRAVATTL